MALCSKCGKKDPCKKPGCPLAYQVFSSIKQEISTKQEYAGQSPNVFVGRFGYPNVRLGILSNEHYNHHDDPQHWINSKYSIKDILTKRAQLSQGTFLSHIKANQHNKLTELSKEIALSKKEVGIEINLKEKPKTNITLSQYTLPSGPKNILKQAQLTENPTISTKVEKAFNDTDVKASTVLHELHKKGVDEHQLTKLLSLGTLGIGAQRKLVPTRYSITAVDSNLSDTNINDLLLMQENSEYQAYLGDYFGNYYLILLFPGPWAYELQEIVLETKQVWTDYENHFKRKSYADETAGGYYSVRYSITEHLKKMKRQATVLCFRFITDEYYAPLGVWVTRQASLNALTNKPLTFSSKELLIEYAKKIAAKKFNYTLDQLLKKSKTIEMISNQKRLFEF